MLSSTIERAAVMTEPLTQIEKESILTLSLMAAFGDGGKSDVERLLKEIPCSVLVVRPPHSARGVKTGRFCSTAGFPDKLVWPKS